LILDTSAVIGWVELQSPSLIAVLDRELADDETPLVHAVTIGELEHGVAHSAPAGDEHAVRGRAATLWFARAELDLVDLSTDSDQPRLYGVISAATGRRIAQNDRWIASGALDGGHTLVTQDPDLAHQLRRVDGLRVIHAAR
jgi:predicted nucleic acid-binding protein